MGEIADMMLDGTMCQCCGEWMNDGEDGEGFPVTCDACLEKEAAGRDVLLSEQRKRKSTTNRESKMHGTVKWYNATKGFGFIQAEDGGKDVFVHSSELRKAHIQDLPEGAKVSFELTTTSKGRNAVNITVL